MSYIETFALKNSTIMLLYSEKEEIQLDPQYQRMGGVWTKEKKQLLIDSILNDYDVPKLYFHEFSRDQKAATGSSYAVVDGRQRLQTIWDFIDGRFPLSQDFEFQRDDSINLAGLTYEDIAKAHPKIRIAFDSFVLPVVGIRTDDEDLIEDMFSRLNEAVPLNAAEKRNAIGGDLVAAIRDIAASDLFFRCVKFGNNRYQHREVAARMLLVEESLKSTGRLIDTKKVYLDALARNYHSGESAHVEELRRASEEVSRAMSGTFSEKDELLQAQGNMIVYYLVFRAGLRTNEVHKITRRKLLSFRERLRENRIMAAEEYAESSFELLEYDRLSQQGTNDSSNIKERFGILAKELGLSAIEI
ncbi:DUF262 domain-containing protein [Denitromonas halophila]|uniref:DUF262 domain-containing protein n=1 Tax=Denitromonas halophila TaxID=1629404 RepID=A0A557QXD9_9RHOO|nr:DUF262 domain-containing protein [Denitromonas halophila]TVO57582.1 DUF262 domain-containing protein [Denitromonas halophila]